MEPWQILVGIIVAPVVAFVALYLRGRMMQKVYAWGRDSYLRFYPNPGVGFRRGDSRWAVSLVGGYERFELIQVSDGKRGTYPFWRRTKAFGSRVKRPGGKV